MTGFLASLSGGPMRFQMIVDGGCAIASEFLTDGQVQATGQSGSGYHRQCDGKR
jgi:hypothetical protein